MAPSGPGGPSRTYDHSAFAWTDGRWRGAPLSGAAIYELHVGTFTPDGTLDAAIERLDHLIGGNAIRALKRHFQRGGGGIGRKECVAGAIGGKLV